MFTTNLWMGSASKNSCAINAVNPESEGNWSRDRYQVIGIPDLVRELWVPFLALFCCSMRLIVPQVFCSCIWVKCGEISIRCKEVTSLEWENCDMTLATSLASVPRPGPNSTTWNGFGHPNLCHSFNNQTAINYKYINALNINNRKFINLYLKVFSRDCLQTYPKKGFFYY